MPISVSKSINHHHMGIRVKNVKSEDANCLDIRSQTFTEREAVLLHYPRAHQSTWTSSAQIAVA